MSVTLCATSHVGTVEIIRCTTAIHAHISQSVAKSRGQRLAALLRGVDLVLQLGCALVDELQLREVRVEDADDLGELIC